MVQWFSSNRLLDVYVNVATGDIVGIEEKTGKSNTNTNTDANAKANSRNKDMAFRNYVHGPRS